MKHTNGNKYVVVVEKKNDTSNPLKTHHTSPSGNRDVNAGFSMELSPRNEKKRILCYLQKILFNSFIKEFLSPMSMHWKSSMDLKAWKDRKLEGELKKVS